LNSSAAYRDTAFLVLNLLIYSLYWYISTNSDGGNAHVEATLALPRQSLVLSSGAEESEAVRRLLIRDVLPQVDADVC
jgi:hypothetical protein